MKDKELRKLLRAKGVIEPDEVDWKSERELEFFGFDTRDQQALLIRIKELEAENCRHNSSHVANQEDHRALIKKIADLGDKFDAINKHYGITVEHEDAKYTVKEDSK